MRGTAAWVTVQVVRPAQLQLSSSVGIPGPRCQEADVTRVGSRGTPKQAVGVITITGNWVTALARLVRVLGWFQVAMPGNRSQRDTITVVGLPRLARRIAGGMDKRASWVMGITKAV